MLTTKLSYEIFNELILLNYKTKESKHELAKTLDIDFEKLELFEIQDIIKRELKKESILNNLNYVTDFEELPFFSFEFQIGALYFRMNNPFDNFNFVNLNDKGKENSFLNKFGSGKLFLMSLLDAIGTENFRVYNKKKHEQTDKLSKSRLIEIKEDEYKIIINGHYCYIKKEYI